jgi:CRISPR/Cas system-associated endonuclease/helicase Cas3
MDFTFVQKEPGKAYIADRLWLPKSHIRPGPVKGALQFVVQSQDGQSKLALWEETEHHIICPREFLPTSEYSRYKFPFIDLRPEFERVEFKSNITPRNDEQAKALEALLQNDNGILNLACGKGKTVLSTAKMEASSPSGRKQS